MGHNKIYLKSIQIILISLIFIVISSSVLAIPAFPGAEGWGAESVGGRGGQVIEVTTLEDAFPAPPGSLRACIAAFGPRTCVFRVGGVIEIAERFTGSGEKVSGFKIKNSFLTIAGQTAPGGGITLNGFEGLIFEDGVHDVIIRNIRIRLDGVGKSGRGQNYITIAKSNYNVIIDHVSGSWTLDDGMSIGNFATKITVQNSLFAEGLEAHSVGSLISGKTDYSITPPLEEYLEMEELSIHHNLYSNGKRNPRVNVGSIQVINNLVYNWGSRVGASSHGTGVDWINNYFKPGPTSSNTVLEHESYGFPDTTITPVPNIYIAGNIVEGRLTDSSADNWELITQWSFGLSTEELEAIFPDSYKEVFPGVPRSFERTTPLTLAPIPVTVQPASSVFDSVITDVGANTRLDCKGNRILNSDNVDTRIIADAIAGTGDSTPSKPGTIGFIAAGTPCADSDKDGMPDEWETLNGFNPNDASDGPLDADGDGYTNLEEFLNGVDDESSSPPPPPPPPIPIPEPDPEPTPPTTILDTTPPIISNPIPITTLTAGTNEVTVSLNTNEPATCGGSTSPGVTEESAIELTTTDGTTHSHTIKISDAKTNTYYVRCKDTAGNANTEDFIIELSKPQPLVEQEGQKPLSTLVIFGAIIVIIILILLVILMLRQRRKF